MRPLLLVVATLALATQTHALQINAVEPYRGAARSARPQSNAVARALRLRGGGALWEWWTGILSKLGLFSKTGKLLVLGLDNAGKSTLLTLLVRDEVVPHAPTHQPVTDVISIGSMKMRAVDMGGHEIARRMWEQYSHDADGIVYIVDAVDRERFPEAGLALHKLLQTLAATTPVLVLGNKDDLQGAAREEELYYCLGLDEIQRAGTGRNLQLQMCSVFEKRGFKEGFDWLSKHIK